VTRETSGEAARVHHAPIKLVPVEVRGGDPPLRDEVEMNDKLNNDKLNPVIDLVSELGQAFNASPKPGSERQPFH
jgi:hypothetical protein